VTAHTDQLRRIAADPHPGRFGLLAAAESAGGLVAAEMQARGLPWRADVHDELLAGLLGPRPLAGLRPARLAALASQISAAFGGRVVNPDSPAQLVKAFAGEGIKIPSTRSGVLREIDHPAVPLLLEYKELARLHAAHGWAWLDEWVCDGRFHPEYVVGGVVSGRWASRGGGALQIPRVLRRAVVADPGWALVVADAAQLEPRVLAALAGDHAFAEAAAAGDLYQALAGAFGGDRAKAKVALLSAMYGGAGGEAAQLLAVLRRRFPLADRYVAAAARAGEEGRVVRSRLGRACPPPSAEWRGLTASADDPDAADQRARRSLRARGRFTRNFVVQASAADWALVLLAGLRRRLNVLSIPNGRCPPLPPGASPSARPGPLAGPGLVFFQHDEVIVHCPEELAPAVVAAVSEAATEAGRLVFGDTPVRFPVSTAVVSCYADAK
jgi:DNA polymerase family A